MQPLREIISEAQVIETEATEEAAAAELLEKARCDIAAGLDTTDDKLHDGLIVLYGKYLLDSPEVVENYERITKELQGKCGQPILMVYRQLDYQQNLDGTPQIARIKTAIAVGIIGAEKIEFDHEGGMAYLPTSRHVYDSHDGKPTIRDRNLAIAYPRHALRAFDLGYDLDNPLKGDLEPWQRLEENDQDLSVMTLAIGDKGIRDWLAVNDSPRINNELDIARELCKALGIEEIPPVTFDQKVYLEVH